MYHLWYALLNGELIGFAIIAALFILTIPCLLYCEQRSDYQPALNFYGWVAAKCLPGIVRRIKIKNRPAKVWFFNMDVSSVFFRKHLLFSLFGMSVLLAGLTLMVFAQKLLVEVSFYCDLEDSQKECFEMVATVISPYLQPWAEPLDCKQAVRDGIAVVCYLGPQLDFGSAFLCSYGVFRLSSSLFTLLSWLIIRNNCECVKCILCIMQTCGACLFKISVTVLPIIFFIFSNVIIRLMLVQILLVCTLWAWFVVLVPWSRLVQLSKGYEEVSFMQPKPVDQSE